MPPPLNPLISLAPPAKFGRQARSTRDPHVDVLDGQPVTGHRPRTLAVLLDDPAATARSLRTHMESAHLMELVLILAEAAAGVLRDRDKPEKR